MLGVAVCFSISGQALADSFDDQIALLKQQANQQQATANLHAAQAKDYQTRVIQLNGQIGALQAQINLNVAQANKVTREISSNEVKLAEKKAVLGSNLKSMYVDSSVTPIMMIASTDNFSEFFNQQQYQDSIKDKIQQGMAEIVETQKVLSQQKIQVEAMLAIQNTQKRELATAKAEVAQLQAIAAQNAAAANAQVAASNAQITTLKAQQAAALAAKYAKSGSGFQSSGNCGGGYPREATSNYTGYNGGRWGCNYAKDQGVDPWAMFNRECVSYTAFRISTAGRGNPTGWGNANQWPSRARANGIPVDFNPRVGDIAVDVSPDLPYGHVMYVEGISGNNIHVSQYNFNNVGEYSTMTIPATGLYFIHFPK